MFSEIFDIVLLIVVFCSVTYGVYFAIKLRLKSNVVTEQALPTLVTIELEHTDDQNIIRIFEDLQKKANEVNPELKVLTEKYKTIAPSIESYQDYWTNLYTNQPSVGSTNHVNI